MIRRAFYVESTLDSDGEWADCCSEIELDFVYPPTTEEIAYRIEQTLLALEPWATRVVDLAFAPA
jgi:hypothetical protein